MKVKTQLLILKDLIANSIASLVRSVRSYKDEIQNWLEVSERDPGYQLMNDSKSGNEDDDSVSPSSLFDEGEEGHGPHAQACLAFHCQP